MGTDARRVSLLREVLNARREKERRQEVTPPVACTNKLNMHKLMHKLMHTCNTYVLKLRRTRSEVSDDDEGDDDDDANRVGTGAAA